MRNSDLKIGHFFKILPSVIIPPHFLTSVSTSVLFALSVSHKARNTVENV